MEKTGPKKKELKRHSRSGPGVYSETSLPWNLGVGWLQISSAQKKVILGSSRVVIAQICGRDAFWCMFPRVETWSGERSAELVSNCETRNPKPETDSEDLTSPGPIETRNPKPETDSNPTFGWLSGSELHEDDNNNTNTNTPTTNNQQPTTTTRTRTRTNNHTHSNLFYNIQNHIKTHSRNKNNYHTITKQITVK